MPQRASSFISSFAAVSFLCAFAAPAAAQQDSGFAFGIRTGYALPMGTEGRVVTGIGVRDVTFSADLSSDTSGMIPIWLDAGYRINPNWYVGAFVQYGFVFINEDNHPECNQFSCSAHDIRFGVNLHYHFSPAASFDPWVGAGIGYETLTVKTSGSLLGVPFETSRDSKGFEFLDLQVGGDFRTSPHFGLGPFVSFSLGEYSSYSVTTSGGGVTGTRTGDLTDTGLHEWLTIGLRGQFNL